MATRTENHPAVQGKGSQAYKLDPFAVQVVPGRNVRREKNYGDIAAMAKSLKANGVAHLDPIIVQRDEGGNFTVWAGHRRLAAVKYAIRELGAEITYIPAFIRRRDVSDEVLLTEAILENDGLRLEPLDLAEAYRRLREAKWTEERIATHMGKSQPHVSQILSLLGAAPAVREALDAREMTLSEALRLISASKQQSDSTDPDSPDLHTRQTEAVTELTSTEPKTRRQRRSRQYLYLQRLHNELETHFGSYEQYKAKTGTKPYTPSENTAFLSGRLSILIELIDASKDIKDLPAVLKQFEEEG